MKVIFLGSSEFSLPSLQVLLSSQHQIVACITTPSKPKGRGLKVESNCVQNLAQDKQLTCFAPAKLNDTQLLENLRQLNPEVLVVASYGKILPTSWLKLPKKLPINVHPSLLPAYRGAAPINWQIINGETKTGVTIFKVEAGLDSGDILAQAQLPLDAKDDAVSLSKKLAEQGARLLQEVLGQIETDSFLLTPQNHEQATYARKLKKEDGLIDWDRSALEISNLIRALVPWPSAYVYFQGALVKIMRGRASSPSCAESKPGVILEVNKTGFIRVQTGRGALLIERVQPAGKREMTAHEFAIGHRLSSGMKF